MAATDGNIMVVGPNYKIVAVSKEEIEALKSERSESVRLCPVMLQATFENEHFAYYDAQEYYTCQFDGPIRIPIDDGGNGGGGSGGDDDDDDGYNDPDLCVLTAHRWTNNDKEHMMGFQYRSIDAFREYHGRWGSIRPHRLTVVYGDMDNNGFTDAKKVFTPSRSDLRKVRLGSNTTKWYSTDSEIQTWDYRDHGDAYKYHWSTIGTGAESTISIAHSTKVSALLFEDLTVNQGLTGTFTITSTDKDREMGEAGYGKASPFTLLNLPCLHF